MKLEDQQTLLFIGDSITDCEHERPVGEREGLGNGYVSLVNSLLAAKEPQTNIKVLNTGIGGNRVDHLETRWKTDALDLMPDWLSVMIGINDVWRQFDRPQQRDQIDIGRYETIYRRLLEQARPQLTGLVLMSPYLLETNPDDPMRQRMDAYRKVVERLAPEFDAIYVDVQAAFDRYLEHRSTQSLCADRVHPNQSGHAIIANAFLQAIGFQ